MPLRASPPTVIIPRREPSRLRRPRSVWPGARYPATILMYHAIADDGEPYTMPVDAFRRQLAVIAASYRVTRLADLPRLAANGDALARVVSITFDDAFVDFVEHAFPLLVEQHMPATMFVPSGLIGRYNAWDTRRGLRRRPLMNVEQLRAVHASRLVDIGSHTVRHVRLTALPPAIARAEVQRSRLALEDLIGEPVRTFSYPYGQLGDFSPVTGRMLAGAGYDLAVTTHWGTGFARPESLRLRRIWLDPGDDDRTIRAKIDGSYRWRTWKERVGYASRQLHLRPRSTDP